MSTKQLPDHAGSWIKASASSNSGECVEMRRRDCMVEVRDGKNPDGPVLRFAPGAFSAWLDGASRGEFGHLAD